MEQMQIHNYKITVKVVGVDWSKLKNGDQVKVQCEMSTKTASLLCTGVHSEHKAVVRSVSQNAHFKEARDLELLVLKLGVIWHGMVAVPSGNGAMFGASGPKKHRH